MGYSSLVISGISWTSAFRFTSRGISFIKNIILARLLSPAQFGVFGIGTLVLALLEILTETGINIFLIQSKKELRDYIHSAWIVSIIRGTIISFSIIITSPFIASFFNTPSAQTLLLSISIVPFIRGFINPAIVSYQKDLQFRKEFYLRISVFIFDALIAITSGLVTKSEFSLVYGLIAGAILEVILSFLLLSLRPRFDVNIEYIKEIFNHGKWVTGYGIFNYFSQQGDNIVVGRILGTHSLGIYQMAYSISLLPITEISDVVSKVTFPIYAKISHDRDRLKNAFLKIFLLTSLASLILGIGIYFFSRQIILLLGESWLTAVPVLKILVIYGVVRTLSGPCSALFLSIGKQKYITAMAGVRFLGLACTIYPFIHLFGLLGAAYSAILSVIIELPVILFFLYKVLKK